mmetsp:Transcript_17142/g.25371  ORF Transcript_17142/g.25371 Transcript_17142/m.25371 type:complete len:498 (+) Transcript_17142:25-1518(+)
MLRPSLSSKLARFNPSKRLLSFSAHKISPSSHSIHSKAIKSAHEAPTTHKTKFSAISSPNFTIVNMPALSPTMESGTIVKWMIEPGSSLSPGDVLCDVETDKATVSFEVQDEGVLAKLIAKENAEIKVGSPVAVTVEDMESYQDFLKFEREGKLPSIENDKISEKPMEGSEESSNAMGRNEFVKENLFSPASKIVAHRLNISIGSVKGTGRGGRVTKGDVISASKAPPASVKVKSSEEAIDLKENEMPSTNPTKRIDIVHGDQGAYIDIPANNIRKVIARRLTESKLTVPHHYVSVEVELDSVLSVRKLLAEKFSTKVSVNDFIIRAASLALRDVPEANAQWENASKKIVSKDEIDISIAVATPTGLITPIIPNADERGLSDISSKVKDLANRAKEGKLMPEEFQGGTFTISNLGMFGIDEFSAVINLPQGCIMAVGGGTKQLRPGNTSAGEKVKPRVATVMTAKLSCDRRAVDEIVAAQFLQTFKCYLQKPQLMVL